MTENRAPAPDTSSSQNSDYTQVPDKLLEKLAACRIPGEQMQCLAVIIRKTYGWHKRSDWIALNQFVEWTGINKPHVKRALNALVDRSIIVAEKGNKKHPSYRINTKFNQWERLPKKATNKRQVAENSINPENGESNPEAGTLPKKATTVAKKGNASLPKMAPTTDTLTKETIQQQQAAGSRSSFSSSVAGQQEGDGLTEEQREYIDLRVEQAAANGEIRSTKSAFRHGLVKRAKEGILDTSSLDELRKKIKPKLPGVIRDAIQTWRDFHDKTPWEVLHLDREEFEGGIFAGEIQYNQHSDAFGMKIESFTDNEGTTFDSAWAVASPEKDIAETYPRFNATHRIEIRPAGKVRVYHLHLDYFKDIDTTSTSKPKRENPY
jgi:phage replication O-like protein O